MAAVFRGRYTAELEGSFVVFLIGMGRVNRWWALHKWLPVAAAMPPMLKQLECERERGLRGALVRQPGTARRLTQVAPAKVHGCSRPRIP